MTNHSVVVKEKRRVLNNIVETIVAFLAKRKCVRLAKTIMRVYMKIFGEYKGWYVG